MIGDEHAPWLDQPRRLHQHPLHVIAMMERGIQRHEIGNARAKRHRMGIGQQRQIANPLCPFQRSPSHIDSDQGPRLAAQVDEQIARPAAHVDDDLIVLAGGRSMLPGVAPRSCG